MLIFSAYVLTSPGFNCLSAAAQMVVYVLTSALASFLFSLTVITSASISAIRFCTFSGNNARTYCTCFRRPSAVSDHRENSTASKSVYPKTFCNILTLSNRIPVVFCLIDNVPRGLALVNRNSTSYSSPSSPTTILANPLSSPLRNTASRFPVNNAPIAFNSVDFPNSLSPVMKYTLPSKSALNSLITWKFDNSNFLIIILSLFLCRGCPRRLLLICLLISFFGVSLFAPC